MDNGVWYQSLNPQDFIERSALAYPEKIAVIAERRRFTYAQMYDRVMRLAGALKNIGVGKGDRVAILAPNTPAMLEAHFGPMRLGALLVAINYRLAPREVAYILNHSGAKVLIFDSELAPIVRGLKEQAPGIGTYVQITDATPKAEDIFGPEYEEFLASASPLQKRVELDSELDTITINYTSGTTGMPKGVQYHARGAYLNALGEALETRMNGSSVYLWTLPMFHANGWCFTWAVTAIGGTHICIRKVDPEEVYRIIKYEGVTHMCCAPTVLISLYSSPAAESQRLDAVAITTAGAPPAPQVIRTIEGMGATLHHAYGLTETFGPHTICAEQPGWGVLPVEERARLKARQGVPYVIANTGLRIVDDAMNDVAWDGETVGEVAMKGNNVMSGYYEDSKATEKAFEGGWFHSGDLAVRHPDGYIELVDRAKDIIISGGENISSQEVEKVLMEHPAVLEACVIGTPDSYWGEVPKAFVVSRSDTDATEQEVIDFCRDRLAHFKCPKTIIFGELPKTATGKVQKFILREREWQTHVKRIN